jgi:hypothetical protein
MSTLQKFNEFGAWRRFFISIFTFAIATCVLNMIFFAMEPVDAIIAVALFGILIAPVLIILPIVARRILKWPVHAVPMMILAAFAISISISLGTFTELELEDQPLFVFLLLNGIAAVMLGAGLWFVRTEPDETAYFALALKAAIGVVTVVLLLRLFFEWTLYDEGHDLKTAGPIICLAIGIGYLLRHKEPFAWGLWPVGALLGGAAFSALLPS